MTGHHFPSGGEKVQRETHSSRQSPFACQHGRGRSPNERGDAPQRHGISIRVRGLASHSASRRITFQNPCAPSSSNGFKTVPADLQGRAHNSGDPRGRFKTLGSQTVSGQIVNVFVSSVQSNGNVVVSANPVDTFSGSSGVELDNCRMFVDSRPLGSVETPGGPTRPVPRFFTSLAKHPDVCVNGVKVDTFDCPDCRVGAYAVKESMRGLNEATLVRTGNSNVLFVRGSLLVGRRGARASAVTRDMVSYWLGERWFVVVYLGVDRTLVNGPTELLKDVGFPFVACCSCSFVSSGGPKLGVIFYNIHEFETIIPPCVYCYEK